MKLYILSLILFFSTSNCQYNLKTVVEHNKNHDSAIVDDVQILEKSSSSSIWKKYYVKIHGLEKAISSVQNCTEKKRSEMCKKGERKYGNIPSNSTRNSARINRIITDIKFSTFEIDTMDVEMGRNTRKF